MTKKTYQQQWRTALKKHASKIERCSVLSNPIEHESKTVDDILSGFVRMADELEERQANNEQITLRCLSARCFWGDAKFLDTKRKIISALYPQFRHCIKLRTIMMSTRISETLEHVIFVENFDSFCALSNAFDHIKEIDPQKISGITLVYSAGFKSSAARSRKLGNSQFVSINSPSEHAFNQFNQWWFKQYDSTVECWFWGDLDFAAMTLLSALRQTFPNTQAWQLGYQQIISYHQQGLGHQHLADKKQNQIDPAMTKCNFADKNLLPLMRNSERFIDQEVVSEKQLIKALRNQ